MADRLVVGSVFKSYKEFLNCFEEHISSKYIFCKLKTKAIESVNKYKKTEAGKYPLEWEYYNITLACKHYGHYTSKSTGLRANQTTLKTGCQAKVTLQANKNKNGLVITDINLDHTMHSDVQDDVKAVRKRWQNLRGSCSKSSTSGSATKTSYLSEQKLLPPALCKWQGETDISAMTQESSPSNSEDSESTDESYTPISYRDGQRKRQRSPGPYAAVKVSKWTNTSPSPALQFFQGLLPQIEELSKRRQREFFVEVSTALFRLLDEQEAEDNDLTFV